MNAATGTLRVPQPSSYLAPCTYVTEYSLSWQCAHKVWCAECTETEAPAACPVCDCAITQALRTYHKRL